MEARSVSQTLGVVAVASVAAGPVQAIVPQERSRKVLRSRKPLFRLLLSVAMVGPVCLCHPIASAQGSENSGWMTGSGQGPFPSAHAACTAYFYSWAGNYWQAGLSWPWYAPPSFTSPTVASCRYWAPMFTEPQAFAGAFYQGTCPAGQFPQARGGCGSVDADRNAGASCVATPNPINIGTGNKYWAEADWRSQGASRFAFQRYYNAQIVRDVIALAANWTHTYTRWIEPIGSTQAFIYRPNGRRLTATLTDATVVNGRQRWATNPVASEQLVKTLDAGNTAIGWELRDPARGEIESYDVIGRLRTIQSPSGYTQTVVFSDGTAGPNGGFVLDASGNPTAAVLPAGLLIRIADSYNRALRFGYDRQSRMTQLVDLQGNAYRYSFDLQRNLTSVAYPDARSRSYLYNETSNIGTTSLPNALTGVIDERGHRLSTHRFDSQGRATSSKWWTDASQSLAVQSFNLDFASSPNTTVTDALGATRTYSFSNIAGLVRLTSQSQPGGAGCGPSSAALSYDANGNVSSRTDFNGSKVCYATDLSRNLETRRVEGVAAGADCATALSSPPTGSRVISTQWHPDWRLETRSAEPNRITTIVYNGQGASCAPSTVLVDGKPPAVVCSRSEQATTDATGALGFGAGLTGTARTWTYTYTTYGRVLTATDPNGKTTTTTYYADDDPDLGRRGNVATLTNAANHVTRLTAYNLHGQPTQIVDPNGLVTDLTYDLRLRLTSRKVGTELTTFTYDPRGLLTNVALPDGASLTYSYDAAHRLVAIADQQGSRIDYTLDAMGNRITERATDNGGTLVRNIQRSIDALNRVQQMVGSN